VSKVHKDYGGFMKLESALATTLLFSFLGKGVLIHAETIEVPSEAPSIMEGIRIAMNGDTVIVHPGTYNENVNFMGKDIVVASLFLLGNGTVNITSTIVRPDSGSVVTFQNGESRAALLSGFTLTKGTGTVLLDDRGFEKRFGGGILIQSADPRIQDNIIIDNSTYPYCNGLGGGIAIMDSARPTISRNTITQNIIVASCTHLAYRGAAIWIDAASNPTIGGSPDKANNIYDNQGAATDGEQVYREGTGEIINAAFNYWGNCPPDQFFISPQNQFDLSNCLDEPVAVEDEHRLEPDNFRLNQNFPNPFNPVTTIRYRVARPGQIEINLYDILGQKVGTVLDRFSQPGEYTVNVYAQELGLSTGTYFYAISVNGKEIDAKRMILLK
jgi:hypothetical protein